jgi:methylmalonyl-CoA epimerase
MAGGPLTAIDHVGIAVHDLEAAIGWYRDVLGAEVAHRERVDSQGVDEALLAVGDGFVQLLTPVNPDSPVARFLDHHGEGIHHVAYRVDDCAAALAEAVAAGASAIDVTPRPGSRGTTVAFLHPSHAFGALVELVEASGRGDAVAHAGDE